MLIGELADRAGVSVKTVRHYEALGLIRSSRLPNGYRDYGEGATRLVTEAHTLNGLGIRLNQTAPFLQCLAAGNANSDDCPDSVAAYRTVLADLDGRIGELTARRDALATLLASAEGHAHPRCQFGDEVHAPADPSYSHERRGSASRREGTAR